MRFYPFRNLVEQEEHVSSVPNFCMCSGKQIVLGREAMARIEQIHLQNEVSIGVSKIKFETFNMYLPLAVTNHHQQVVLQV